jgi:hypothetical protein
MGVQSYIRSKMLPQKLHFKLLEIARKDSIIMDLIDLATETSIDMADQDREINRLNIKIQDLEQDLTERSWGKVTLEETINLNSLCEKSYFTKFINEFHETNKRYPSIDEVWEAAWNKYKKSLNNI